MKITIVPPIGSDSNRKNQTCSSDSAFDSGDRKRGTFEDLTTKTARPEVVVRREKDTAQIDLTRDVLRNMGLDSPVAQLVPALPRLRVVVVDEGGDLKNAKTIQK